MNILRIKQQARFFILCTMGVLACFMTYMFRIYSPADPSPWEAANVFLSLPELILILLGFFRAFMLLRNIIVLESPFTIQNVRHLQWIGWLLAAYEPIAYLRQAISNRYFPITFENGVFMTTSQTHGGIFLVCGFLVLTVAAIFRYGTELQQLSDETL